MITGNGVTGRESAVLGGSESNCRGRIAFIYHRRGMWSASGGNSVYKLLRLYSQPLIPLSVIYIHHFIIKQWVIPPFYRINQFSERLIVIFQSHLARVKSWVCIELFKFGGTALQSLAELHV